MAERQDLLALAANIVSAHVSNNDIAVDQLPGLIQHVLNALATVPLMVEWVRWCRGFRCLF